jgi:hypothetical protein
MSLRQAKAARAMLANVDYVLEQLLPGGEWQGVEYSVPNPTRDDEKAGSFKINREGMWADFATDDAGADLVELLAYIEGHTNGSAVKAAEDFCKQHGLAAPRGRPKKVKAAPVKPLREKPAAEPIDEAELDELPPDYHPEHGAVTADWAYRDADGKTLFHVLRIDSEAGKQTLPCRFIPSKDSWHWSRPPGTQPLFNLDRIERGARILLGEGEKTAAHLDSFEGFVGTTTGGSDSLLKSDLTPLQEALSVDIFPDADEPGEKFALKVMAYCLIREVPVRMLDVRELGWSGGEDAADHPGECFEWYEPNLLDMRGFIEKYRETRRKLDSALCEVAALMEPVDYDRAKDRLCELLGCGKRALDAAVKPYRRKERSESEPEEGETDPTAEEIAAYRETLENDLGDFIYRPDILEEVSSTLERMGMVGEHGVTRLTYLAVTSRLLNKPVNVIVKGSSSSGKSYTTQTTLKLFPSDAFYTLSGGSAKSLIYTPEDFSHRTLVILEASTLNGASEDDSYSMFLRTLISEGFIRYETVEKNEGGELEARVVEKAGPTNLILTTTASSIHHENETRMLSVYPDESEEQTRAVMGMIAKQYGSPREHEAIEDELEQWHHFHMWIATGEHRVVIPYMRQVVEAVSHAPVRFRRDVTQLGSLIQTSAILHQASRERDEGGRIIATLADYGTAREVILQSLSISANEAVEPREVSILKHVYGELVAIDPEATTPIRISSGSIAKALGIAPRTIRYQINKMVESGYLLNVEQFPKRPMRLKVGPDFYEELIGESAAILPPVAGLEGTL